MTQTASPLLADRLKLIIEGLCHAIARRVGLGGLAGPLIVLIWTRLRGLYPSKQALQVSRCLHPLMEDANNIKA